MTEVSIYPTGLKLTKSQNEVLTSIVENERGTNYITVNRKESNVLIQVRHYEFGQLCRFDSYEVTKRGKVDKY